MLNNISIMGRFVRDPELRYTPQGTAVSNFTLAVDRDRKNANGDRQTDFIDCQAWQKTAEMIAQYFSKGRLAVVNGRLQTRTYKNDKGENRKTYEIVVQSIYFADSKKDSSSAAKDEFIEVDFSADELPF